MKMINNVKYLLIIAVIFAGCKNDKSSAKTTEVESSLPEQQVSSAPEKDNQKASEPVIKNNSSNSQFDTITVSNLEDLVDHAKDNTVVILEGGTHTIEEHIVYYVNKDERRVIDKKKEQSRSMGGQLYLSGLKNFHLIGKKGTVITSKNPAAIPLFVVKGSRLLFSNLTISKSVEGAADLSYISGCKNVEFSRCNFDGGGTHGLNILNTNQMTFKNCKIQHCSKGILKAYVSLGLKFINSEFSENNCSVAPINIYGDGSSVTFNNVIIRNNRKDTSTSFEDSDKLITIGANSLFINNSVIENNTGFKFLGISSNLLNNTSVNGLQ